MAVKAHRTGLNRETRELLEYVRRASPVNKACGLPVEVAKAQAHAAVDRVVEACRLEHPVEMELRWFVEDVAKALCAGQGEALALELGFILGRWQAYNLEPNTVQLLMKMILQEVSGIAVPEKDKVVSTKD